MYVCMCVCLPFGGSGGAWHLIFIFGFQTHFPPAPCWFSQSFWFIFPAHAESGFDR